MRFSAPFGRATSTFAARGSFALSAFAVSGIVSLALSACGDERQIPMEVLPSADETRAYFGLTNGSCVRYRFNTSLRADSVITGPNMSSIAGRTVFERSFNVSGQGLADTWFIEAQDDGELRLLRFDTSTMDGQRLSTRYACVGSEMCPETDMQEPLLLQLRFDDAMTATLEQGQRFEVTTTPPSVSLGMPEAERHTVIVQGVGVDVPVPGGTTESGVELTYARRLGNASPVTTTLRIVPGKGIAQIQEGGRTYQACAWRYCDASGNCQGAADCAQLTCN